MWSEHPIPGVRSDGKRLESGRSPWARRAVTTGSIAHAKGVIDGTTLWSLLIEGSRRFSLRRRRQLEDKPASKARWEELRPVVDVRAYK